MDASTLAHWDRDHTGISGVIVVPKQIKTHINTKQGSSDSYGHQIREEMPWGDCQWCFMNECVAGNFTTSWHEELDQEPDFGQKKVIEKLRAPYGRQSHGDNLFKTITYHCKLLKEVHTRGHEGILKFQLPYDVAHPRELAEKNFTFRMPIQMATKEALMRRSLN